MSRSGGTSEARLPGRAEDPVRSGEQFFARFIGLGALAALAFGIGELAYGAFIDDAPLRRDGVLTSILGGLLFGCRWIARHRTSSMAASSVIGTVSIFALVDVWIAPETHRSLAFIVLAGVMAALPHLRGVHARLSMGLGMAVMLTVEGLGVALEPQLTLGLTERVVLQVLAIGIAVGLVLNLLFHQLSLLRGREQELEAAVLARDEFLSIASHELRTPITAIKLAIQSIRQRVARGSTVAPEQLAAVLQRVDRQAELLVGHVDRLLDVNRVAEGHLVLQHQDVDLEELARQAVAELADRFPASPSQVKLHASGDTRGAWDRFWLEHVLQNLLSNAIRYGEGLDVELGITGEGESVLLSVRDHGIGIAQADRERIFERFERAVPSRHYGGFGIGLWLTRQIVLAHGGAIAVSSEPGQGSEFVVRLPRAQNEERSRP